MQSAYQEWEQLEKKYQQAEKLWSVPLASLRKECERIEKIFLPKFLSHPRTDLDHMYAKRCQKALEELSHVLERRTAYARIVRMQVSNKGNVEDHYEVLRQLGETTLGGHVVLARHRRTKRLVAIKRSPLHMMCRCGKEFPLHETTVYRIFQRQAPWSHHPSFAWVFLLSGRVLFPRDVVILCVSPTPLADGRPMCFSSLFILGGFVAQQIDPAPGLVLAAESLPKGGHSNALDNGLQSAKGEEGGHAAAVESRRCAQSFTFRRMRYSASSVGSSTSCAHGPCGAWANQLIKYYFLLSNCQEFFAQFGQYRNTGGPPLLGGGGGGSGEEKKASSINRSGHQHIAQFIEDFADEQLKIHRCHAPPPPSQTSSYSSSSLS
eukprot:jgi/Bigna1/72471/fgenesh1_pg.20_\